jgi:hypothetical protein
MIGEAVAAAWDLPAAPVAVGVAGAVVDAVDVAAAVVDEERPRCADQRPATALSITGGYGQQSNHGKNKSIQLNRIAYWPVLREKPNQYGQVITNHCELTLHR